ncbi:ATP-binding cassette domain-containing protein [Azospirillum sp. SYSU D00513]|uniref:energy-coupling factor ABC transporter ATP-binding protein n=1 Tax=Azospirillum sp. SYSU D00513 TaxID=2812561 RepID=UPI001A95BD9D|nr:ATP-binding cassette domain-containing protein [Azospirillum sp. SYSU D00513]
MGVTVTLRDIRFRPDGRTVLDGVNAVVGPKGITAIAGPNGAGKSVLLRIIDGLLTADSGSVEFQGTGARPVRRAFVFQKPGLIRASTAENAALALLPMKLPRQEAARRVEEALAHVGLAGRAGDPARKLSGGEQQRLALARALLTEPDLLLLDEPTASLDPNATEEVERLVAQVAAGGTKVILVSHNLAQVARLARDLILLTEGRVAEQGSARALLTNPQTPEARAYLKGEMPWLSYPAAAC